MDSSGYTLHTGCASWDQERERERERQDNRQQLAYKFINGPGFAVSVTDDNYETGDRACMQMLCLSVIERRYRWTERLEQQIAALVASRRADWRGWLLLLQQLLYSQAGRSL